jgi:hypothetical protein
MFKGIRRQGDCPLILFEKINRPVYSSPDQPGFYFVFLPDTFIFVIDGNKDFLNYVFCKLSVLCNSDGYTIKL